MHLSQKRHRMPTICQVFLVVGTGITANNTKSLPYIVKSKTIFLTEIIAQSRTPITSQEESQGLNLLSCMKQLKKKKKDKIYETTA